MKKFISFLITVTLFRIATAQDVKITLDSIEDELTAILIIHGAVESYDKQEYKAILHDNSSEILLSLFFKPGLLANDHAVTYRATYQSATKSLHFYELERSIYAEPGRPIYRPAKYLMRHSVGSALFVTNNTIKKIEAKFMVFLQKTKNDTLSLSAKKLKINQQKERQRVLEQEKEQEITERKRQAVENHQKSREVFQTLQEGDVVCARETNCDAPYQDDCLKVSAFIEGWNQNKTKYRLRIHSVSMGAVTYTDPAGAYAEVDGVRYHKGEIIWIDPLERANTTWISCKLK
jgi:hypothetical protein